MNKWRDKLTISPGFILMGAFLFYLDGSVVLWAALAALLHEMGHFVMLSALGGGMEGVRLTITGAEMLVDRNRPLSYGRELLAALAGPAVSFAAAWAAARMGAFLFAGLSLALGVFNLLPARQLDGGRALYAAAASFFQERWAAGLTRATSVLTVGILLGLGAAVFRLYGNFTLFITALWLFGGLFRK